jgi:hypothetical protein
MLHNSALPKKETLLLPPAITRVYFMDYDNNSGNFLPPTVTNLSLASLTNIPLTPGFLPPALTHLYFPGAFNSPVGTDNLPTSLTHIFFGEQFNQPVCSSVLIFILLYCILYFILILFIGEQFTYFSYSFSFWN